MPRSTTISISCYRIAVARRKGAAAYRQAAGRGWQVRKGEKGAIVFFYKKLEIRGDDEDKRTIPLLRAYVVFHASQLDGIPELGEPEAPRPVAERIADADLIVKASGVRVAIGGGRAYYAPSTDHIQMPPDEAFHTPEQRAATLFHELSHASGHVSRLNRVLSGRFSSVSYSKEELRADLASFFVGNTLGFPATSLNTQAIFSPWSTSSRTTNARSFAQRPTPIGSPSGSFPTIRRMASATTSPTRRTMSSRRSLRPRP